MYIDVCDIASIIIDGAKPTSMAELLELALRPLTALTLYLKTELQKPVSDPHYVLHY